MTLRTIFAAGLGASVLACSGIASAQTLTALKVPDLSHYDCRLSIQPPSGSTLTTTHIGQVIKGKYAEWNEFYLAAADAPAQLVCISHLRPQARQLSATQAKLFLTDSFAIGAPNGNAASHAQGAVAGIIPEKVQPEPRKRLITSTTNGVHAQSAADPLPPVPVTKASDPASPENTAPVEVSSVNTSLFATSTAPAETTGVEDRIAVTGTTAYPWNTVGYLIVTYPTGASFRCSATLVSPYVVLTAGHCIHNNTRGGFVAQAAFYPAQSQASSSSTVARPYSGHSDWQNLKATQGWIAISGQDAYPVDQYQSDFAAVQFKTPFTFTSTFMPVVYGSTVTTVTSDGYPAVVNNADQYGQFTETGPETTPSLRSVHVREFGVDSSGGNSGGPFWMTDANTGRPGLVGSLSYGDDTNNRSGGPWYDSWNQALLSDWITWTPNSVQTANSTSGLRVASVFSSTQQNAMSFIRLYNPGATAGTVDVTLGNAATGAALGTWTSPSIPAGAEMQFAMSTLEQGATTPITNPPAFYSLSVRPSFSGYFQHVLMRAGAGPLTDASTCDDKTTTDPTFLVAVHSSLLQSAYPSTVVVHNTGSSATTVSLGIYDARNGARLGTYRTPTLQPNQQDVHAISAIEAAAGFAPSGTMYHYIIRADASFTGYLQHLMNNVTTNVVTDMTGFCAMSP